MAYTKDKRLAKGKISAASKEAASKLLDHGGYQILSLKQHIPFFNLSKLTSSFSRIKPTEVILFSRQLALLLDSGIDIVTALELLQDQVDNRAFKNIIGAVASDIRGGSSLSMAMSKHPQAFSHIYHRAIAAGEEGGNLGMVLTHMANFIERIVKTEKKIRAALTYPVIVAIVATLVVGLMVIFVLPSFTSLYSTLGTDIPTATKILMNTTTWLTDYGLFLFGGIAVAFILFLLYIRTPNGKYQWDKTSLRLPVIGRILLLSELSRVCQTIALLFRAGLPLPEIMTQTISGTNNKVIAKALTEVQRDLIRGEGLFKPMGKNRIFLPLMVQMVGVGEETGKLDDTLSTVVTTYDVESDDRISAAIGLIQPIMTIAIGLIVGFVAVALVSSMYSMYGEGSF